MENKHPVLSTFLPLSKVEKSRLKESLSKRRKLLSPIVFCTIGTSKKKYIFDGYERINICEKQGIDYKDQTTTLHFDDLIETVIERFNRQKIERGWNAFSYYYNGLRLQKTLSEIDPKRKFKLEDYLSIKRNSKYQYRKIYNTYKHQEKTIEELLSGELKPLEALSAIELRSKKTIKLEGEHLQDLREDFFNLVPEGLLSKKAKMGQSPFVCEKKIRNFLIVHYLLKNHKPNRNTLSKEVLNRASVIFGLSTKSIKIQYAAYVPKYKQLITHRPHLHHA